MSRGLTLVEVLVAVGLLAVGLTPILLLLSQSRGASVRSIHEMRATAMASSMIDALKRVPGDSLLPLFGQEFRDDQLPPAFRLAKLSVPPAHENLVRRVQVGVVNQPSLPAERFSNPWGRLAEIHVTVTRATQRQGQPEEIVLSMKGYRPLDETD